MNVSCPWSRFSSGVFLKVSFYSHDYSMTVTPALKTLIQVFVFIQVCIFKYVLIQVWWFQVEICVLSKLKKGSELRDPIPIERHIHSIVRVSVFGCFLFCFCFHYITKVSINWTNGSERSLKTSLNYFQFAFTS